MAVPDFQSMMLPLLESTSDGKPRSLAELRGAIAKTLGLTEEDRKELLPSGAQPVFNNRLAWASIYLHRAGLLARPQRGWYQIAEKGLEVLKEKPERIDVHFLERFPEFVEFRQSSKEKDKKKIITGETGEGTNPEEALESAFQELQENLASELLESIKKCPPDCLERLVVDVLIKMGYGGSRKEAGQAIGRTGDEGIDGIIKEDKLGLDIIYIQAKRWGNTVGRAEIQKFAGALQGQRAHKGIFITTSNFSKDALDYVNNIESKIILIDGQRFAEFMIENNVGVSPVASYEIKKIDIDYFIEN
jgi:restriction system protein